MTHYPHMLAEDTSVWTKFLTTSRLVISEVWYDVHVGRGVVLPVGADELTQRIARGVTRKRIDVVAAVGGGYWVIEVKPFASMFALGQIVSYTGLFLQEYTVDGEVIPVIICDSYDEDLVEEFDALSVVVIQND